MTGVRRRWPGAVAGLSLGLLTVTGLGTASASDAAAASPVRTATTTPTAPTVAPGIRNGTATSLAAASAGQPAADPAPTDPPTTDPPTTDPAPTEPLPTAPAPAEPAPTDAPSGVVVPPGTTATPGPSTYVFRMEGGILGTWRALGGEPVVGAPSQPMRAIRSAVSPSIPAWSQVFTARIITFSERPGVGGHSVAPSGAIGDRWMRLGAHASNLGLPTTQERATSQSGWRQDFEGGTIYWGPTTGARTSGGGIRTYYDSLGGPGSGLGLPTTDLYATANGWVQDFQRGRIIWRADGSHRYVLWNVPTMRIQQASIHKADWWRVTGSVTNADAGQAVNVDALVGGRWVPIQSAQLSATRTFDFVVPWNQGVIGSWSLRVCTLEATGNWRCTGAATATRRQIDPFRSYGHAGSASTFTNAQPMPRLPTTVTAIPNWQWNMMSVASAENGGRRSYYPGCPAGRDQLRRIEISYWGFDSQWHRGWITARYDAVPYIVSSIERISSQGFPLRRVEGVEMFGNSDRVSMAADNTSAMNCRQSDELMTPSALWVDSHANGFAIDLNTFENPYLDPRAAVGWQPPAAAAHWQRRSNTIKGQINANSVPWTVMHANGPWRWNPYPSNPDWQHFDLRGTLPNNR